MEPQPENKTILFKKTGKDNERETGKTGKISCVNGFTAEIRVIKPHPSYKKKKWDSGYPFMMFVADKIPIDEVYNKTTSLTGKDDPSALAYGVWIGNST